MTALDQAHPSNESGGKTWAQADIQLVSNPVTVQSKVSPAPYSYRADPAVPTFADDKPIIIFDGHCVMCSGFARFVLRHDTAARFRLLPAQTDLARALFVHYGYDPDDFQTFILLENGTGKFKMDAALSIFSRFGFPWALAGVLGFLPAGSRSQLYDLIAHNRYRILGRREVCYRSDPAHLERFLP